VFPLLFSLAAFATPPLESLGQDELEWTDINLVEFDAAVARTAGTPGAPSGIWEGDMVRGAHTNVVALAMIDPWYGQLSVFCTGSVIHPEWILTASHCLEAVEPYEAYGMEFYALTGDNMVSGNYDDVAPFRRIHIHPDFTGSSGAILHDIGLVRLDSELNNVPIAVMNDKTVKDGWVGDEHNYVGFGSTYDNRGDSGVKHETWIPIDSFDDMYLYGYSPDSNVCSGDSGGPSFRDTSVGPVQVGVNVYVTPGCAGGANGSTRVDAYLPWIEDKVGDLVLFTDLEDGGTTGGTTGGTDIGTEGGSGGLDRPSGAPAGFSDGWADPVVPEKGTYALGMRCSTGGTSGGSWLVLPLLGLALRRRSSR
jgi:V8-like Glu-specific endopeptidase